MNETVCTEYLIIGSGPSGIGAALSLANEGKKILLIDAGKHFSSRHCHVEDQKDCNDCRVCNELAGFGGCFLWGNGAKFSKFPSGNRLFKKIGNKRSNELTEKFEHLIINKTIKTEYSYPQQRNTIFPMKHYPVARIPESSVKILIEKLYDDLDKNSNIDLLLKTEALNLKILGKKFQVNISVEGSPKIVNADKVIVAVGRFGREWWRLIIKELGINRKPRTWSAGVRFECPNEPIKHAENIHKDFKISLQKDGIKIKTFCFCIGQGGGIIKFQPYGEYTLLDGQIMPESNLKVGNFALLAQIPNPNASHQIKQKELNKLINSYRALRQKKPGRPVIQWYPDFKRTSLKCQKYSELELKIGRSLSKKGFEVAALSSIFSSTVRDSICSVFEDIIKSFLGEVNQRSLDQFLEQTVVAGLEIESMWDEIIVNEKMECSVKNLYVVGDANGLSQGIFQAFCSGLAVSD